MDDLVVTDHDEVLDELRPQAGCAAQFQMETENSAKKVHEDDALPDMEGKSGVLIPPHRTVAKVESTPRRYREHSRQGQNMPEPLLISEQSVEPFSDIVPESRGDELIGQKQDALTTLDLNRAYGEDITESVTGLSIHDYFLLRREMGVSPSRPFSPSGGAAGRRKGLERPLSRSARAFEDLIRKPSCSVGELHRAFQIQFRYFANRDARTVYKILSKSISESNTITLSTRAASKISLADFIPYYDPLMFKDVRKGLIVIFDPTLDTQGLNYSLEASYHLGDHKHLLRTNISSDGLTEGLELTGATWNGSADALLPCQMGDPVGDRKNWLPGWAGVTPLFIPSDECMLSLHVIRKQSLAPSRAASSTSASTWMKSRGAGRSERRFSVKKGLDSAASASRGFEVGFLSDYPMAPPEFIADSIPRSPPRSAPSMFIKEPEFEEPNELNTLRARIIYFEAKSIQKAIKLINSSVYPQLRAWVASGGSGSAVGHLNIAAMHGNMNAVKFLVETIHADVNSRCAASMFTPLHEAAQNGHTDILRYLLSKGANPTLVDTNGRTALHLACISSNIPATRALLECEQWRQVAFTRDNDGRSMRQVCSSKFILSLIDDALHRHHAFRLFLKLDLDAQEAVEKRRLLRKHARSPVMRPSSSTRLRNDCAEFRGESKTDAALMNQASQVPSAIVRESGHGPQQRPVSAAAASGSASVNMGVAMSRPGTSGTIKRAGEHANSKNSSIRGGDEVGSAWAGPRSSEALLAEKHRLLYGSHAKKGKKRGGVAT